MKQRHTQKSVHIALATLAALTLSINNLAAKNVGVLVEYFEVEPTAVPAMLRAYQLEADASGLLKRVQALEKMDEARLVESSYLTATAGQRSTIESIRKFIYPTEWDPAEVPQILTGPIDPETVIMTPATPTAFDVQALGMTVELEAVPVAAALGRAPIIDLNLALKLTRLAGETSYGIGPSTSKQPLFEAMRLATRLQVADATTALVGMHSLETARAGKSATVAEQQAVGDRRVLIFVTAKVKGLK